MRLTDPGKRSARARRDDELKGDIRRSADDKAWILEETLMPGVVVSEVAGRHRLRPQQVFGWRRESRIEPEAGSVVPAFVPG